MSAWVAKKTNSPVATESEAVIALGARTSRLHVEIKRLRAWWREILRKKLTPKLAEHVSAATQIDGSPLLLVDGKRHPHLTLLERSKAFVSEGLDGEVLGALHDMVGQAAGVDLECRELAAIIGGCDMGWRTNLLWTPVATNEERQKKPGLGAACLEKGEALGVAMSVLSRGGGLDLNGEAHEIRQVADREQDGDENREFRGQSGRVVLYHHDQEEEALKMVTQVRRARSWHRRHPACFLPIAWAVSASVAASWDCGDDDDDQCDTSRKQQKTKTLGSLDGQANGGAVEDGLRRPSRYSILALVAAFLDKESTAKGFISRRGSGRPKAAFGGGRDVTYGKTNPNLGELFLRFCSWVEKLGTGEQPTASLELGADGTLHHWQRGSTSATESNRPKEGEPSKDAPVQLFVNGEPCEDLADVRVSSHLRRTCGRVERALIPDGIRGLRVWNNDPRWSLLGYALARRVAPSKEANVQEGWEVNLHYVDWMEVLLEMCEDPNHPDAGLGMIGFTLTCDSAPKPEWREQVEARNLADVLCARSANEAFAVAELLQSASAGKGDNAVNVQARERGDDSLLGDSDSLGRGSGSDENNEDNEAIDGVPLTAVTLPFPVAAVASAPPLLPGQHLASMEMGDEGEEEKGINGTPLVLPGPLLHPGPVFPALQSLSPSALSAPAIGAVIARGDKLLREAASAVAAARNAASKETTRRTPEAQKTLQSGSNDTAVRARQGHDMDQSQDYNSAARDNTEAGERGRTRALAKQRGRERGKQREQELEAEKLKKAEREKDRDAERQRQRRLRQEEYEERVSQRRVHDEERKNESRRFERRASATDAVRCKGTSRGNSESDKVINDVKRPLSDARTSSKSATCSSRSASSSSTSDSTSGSRSRSGSSLWKSKSDRCDATSRSPQPTQSGRGDSADGAAEVSAAVDWSPWRSVDSNDSSSADESSVRQETDAAGKVDLGRHRGTEMRRERSVSMGSGRDGVESLGASTGKTSTRQRRIGGQEKGSDDDRVALSGNNERRRASQAVVGGERSARGRGSYRLDGRRGSGSGGRDERTRSSSMDDRRRRRHSKEHGRARSRSPFSLERDGRHSRGHLRQSTRMMSRDREPREVQSRLNGRSRRESSRSRELRLRRAGAWRRGINSRSRSGSRGRSRSRERRFPRSRSRERRRVRSHSRSLSTSLNRKERRSSECRPSGLPPGHETTRHSNTVPSSSGASTTTGKGLLSKGGVKNKNAAPMLGATPNHAVPPATVSAAAPKERVSSEGGIKNNSAAPQSGAVPVSAMQTIKSAGSQRADAAFGHGSGTTTGVFLGADRMSLYKTFLAVDTIEDEDSMEEGEMDTRGDQDGMEEGEMVTIEDQGGMEEGEITLLNTKPSKQQPSFLKQLPNSPPGSTQPKKPLLAAAAVVAAAAIAKPTVGNQQVQTPPGSKQQPLKLVQKSPPGPKQPKKPLPTAAAAVEATAKLSIASQQVQTRPGSKQQSKPQTQPVLEQVPTSAPGSKQPKKPLPAAAALAKPTVVGEQVPTPPGSKQQPKQPVLKQVPKSPPGSKQLNKKPLPKAAVVAAATPKPTVAGQQEVQMPPRSKVQPTHQSVLKQVPKSPPGSTQPKESLPKATVVSAAKAQPTVARRRVQTPPGQGKNYKKNRLRRERKAAAAAAAAVAAKVAARIVVEVTTVGGTTNNSDTPAKENAIGDGNLVVSDDRGGDADV